MSNPSNAAIYARISKDDDGTRLGVERQIRLCRELAERAQVTVVEVIIDNDVSAMAIKRRPGFERLVELLTGRDIDVVLAYHTDRLYRRTTDLERIVTIVEESGAQVLTCAAGTIDLSTASGRMVARMLGAAAQHESERLSERARAKHDELAASGAPPGGRPPFGFATGYVHDPVEAEAVRFMALRVLAGVSLLGLARVLDARGIRTREGRPWHHSTVRAALVNPAVAGLRVHRWKAKRRAGVNEIVGPGQWEPILDRATWEEVRATLMDPARRRTRPARKYLLAGMVKNTNGDPLVGRPDRAAQGGIRRTYATRTPAKPALTVSADQLEGAVIEAVKAAFDDAALPIPGRPDLGAAEAQVNAELAELADLRGRGVITLAEWMAARGPLLERLQAAGAAWGTRSPAPAVHLLSTPGAVRRGWPEAFDDQRAILRAVIERVIVLPASRGRWTPIEDRLLPEGGGGMVWRV